MQFERRFEQFLPQALKGPIGLRNVIQRMICCTWKKLILVSPNENIENEDIQTLKRKNVAHINDWFNLNFWNYRDHERNTTFANHGTSYRETFRLNIRKSLKNSTRQQHLIEWFCVNGSVDN